jgi:hypothetical protein
METKYEGYTVKVEIVKKINGATAWDLFVIKNDIILIHQEYSSYWREDEVIGIGISYVISIGGKCDY